MAPVRVLAAAVDLSTLLIRLAGDRKRASPEKSSDQVEAVFGPFFRTGHVMIPPSSPPSSKLYQGPVEKSISSALFSLRTQPGGKALISLTNATAMMWTNGGHIIIRTFRPGFGDVG